MKIIAKHKIDLQQAKLTYALPHERIAEFPAEPRHNAKMLVYDGSQITDKVFWNLSSYLAPGDLLLFNNSRVINARIIFYKTSGARIEVFCLEPVSPADMQMNLNSKHRVQWNCFVGNAKKWKDEILQRTIQINGQDILVRVTKMGKVDNVFTLQFEWDTDFLFHEIIENVGIIPLPPYIDRDTVTSDEVNYQTVYARIDGSVAAPTAGLHFSKELLREISNKKVVIDEVTLHVGAGTFKPIESEYIQEHKMHNERIFVQKQTILNILNKKGRVVAVGTTTVRSLESIYWLGVRLVLFPQIPATEPIGQWLPYTVQQHISTHDALQRVLHYMDEMNVSYIQFSTEILIVPGYDFRVIEQIVTNFHQPESTLLLLVAAFVGNSWLSIYEHALAHEYRFLSFGDACLLTQKVENESNS